MTAHDRLKIIQLTLMMVSQFYGTSTSKGSYRPKTGNDCNVNSSGCSLRTALCESIWWAWPDSLVGYQAKPERPTRPDTRGAGEADLEQDRKVTSGEVV